MKLSKRVLTIILVVSSMLLYLPVNRLVSGGYNLEIPLDKLIPLIPVFVVPYLLAIAFWYFTIIYVGLTQKRETVLLMVRLFIIASVLSAIISVVFPTFVANRPTITSTDVLSQLLKLIYTNDLAYNAAPSGHTFFTLISVWILVGINPRLKAALYIFAATVLVSTLFTRQHNILDVVIGVVFAVFVSFLAKKLSPATEYLHQVSLGSQQNLDEHV